jgi:hypothetical protein
MGFGHARQPRWRGGVKHLIDEPPTDDREPPPIRGESSGWIGGDCWTFRGFAPRGIQRLSLRLPLRARDRLWPHSQLVSPG